MAAISLIRVVKSVSMGGGWGDSSTANTPAPMPAKMVCKAATRYVRKRVGSLSPASSDSQATGRGGVASPRPADPFADQRGFAKAGGGRDEGQLAARRETLVQPLDQAGRRTTLGRVGGYKV